MADIGRRLAELKNDEGEEDLRNKHMVCKYNIEF